MLMFFVATLVAELALFFTPLWKLRKLLAPLLVLAIPTSTVLLALQLKPVFVVILLIVAVFRTITLARVIKRRMHHYYLLYASRRTSAILLLILLAAVYGAVVLDSYLTSTALLFVVVVLQMIVAGFLLVTVLKNTSKLSYNKPSSFLADNDLPTVSVCIPARNETTDLEQCLRSVLRSDYPKLEVIVLDDCSQLKTAEVIKSFAHDGVRFVPGEEPAKRWLAKNQAYHKLYKEAKGQVVLFIGVDVRLSRTAIRAMVNTMYDRKKAMLSVLPTLEQVDSKTAIFQPMRYWWELAPPRRLFNRPPVLSTCWMIDHSFLKSLGGLASVSHSILPEGYFAREAVKHDLYSFIRSSSDLGVQTAKDLPEQRETVLRVRYPQLRRRPENVLLVSAIEIFILLLPLPMLLLMWPNLGWLKLLLAITILLVGVTHALILRLTSRSNFLVAMLTFPLSAVAELIAGWASMFTYEFGTVTWKDRNVCIPVMHAVPKKEFLENGHIN